MSETDAPGGAEVFLLQSAEELRRRGYRVLPVLPSWKTGWLGSQFEDRGFRSLTYTIERTFDWKCLKDLVAKLRESGVDVLHSHEFSMAVYGAVISRILRKRHVVTMHGNMWMTQAWKRRTALRWAFRASDAVVAVSEDTRKHLLETLRLRESAVMTIPNGIPDPGGDRSGPVREFGLGPEEVVLLAVGNLIERKGHMVLLQSLALLHHAGCSVPWRLIIAGEGPERRRLEDFLRENGLEERVHLAGYRSDVGNLQAAADILVMPSLWEGLPLAVLEGMYAANAVVGSSISGIPEAVRDGVEGFLVPPGDAHALAAALRTLLEDDSLRESMGEAARERARTRFSIERMVDDYEALYVD